MDSSPNLTLPYIVAAQAQKHVTHNEAIRALDALVQLMVLDKDLASPPGSPADGNRYIVAASPTGAWAGQAGKIAAYQDGAWAFYGPREGWLAWAADEDKIYYYSGSAWVVFISGGDLLAANNLSDVASKIASFDNLSLRGSDVASASTVDLGTATGDVVDVTGTTTITAVTLGDGKRRWVRFTGALTLTHGASLVLPGAASITTAAGDWALFVGYASSVVRVAAYVKASGKAVIAPAFSDITSPPTTLAGYGITDAREKLAANRTYYVRTDGSNSNDGLTNSSGGAFLTLQKAVDTVASLDMGIYQATIQVGDGTYTGACALRPWVGTLAPIIQGNNSTPANVIVSTTSASCFANTGAGDWHVRDMELRTTTAGNCLLANAFGVIHFQNLRFGACAGVQIYAQAGEIIATGDYAIVGGAANHYASNGTISIVGVTVTLTGTPAFSATFARAGRGGVLDAFATTYSGSATGVRYDAFHNGVIFTNGAGANYFPGNSAGSTATGGQYA